ncbi:MAG TPA: MFS transporter [Nocardioides sp.]|jgi:EmrB/QacA subfamily drug resistance transporter|uniref:MFS transporter n=1 Tax=Nocardioides sp. TaxID=35761 RepID=UPI002E3005F6|nr:MFS transporter [Nocardioides sp.]HEX3930205.1 MFS transporter [Nocardioides sp.]
MLHKRGLAMGVLIFASFMDLLDATIVNVALPSIRDDLGASGAQLEWTVGGYLLAFAVLMITGGRLGDIFGRRRLFVAGVVGFTLGSALACIAPSIGVLLLARVVQGGFAAMMVPQVLSSLQALYDARERAAMLGVIGAVSGMSAVIGPVLGGWLVSSNAFGIGWRSIFLINLPIGAALVALALRFVPDTRSEHPLRLDPLGLLLATAGLLGVVYALVEGRDQDWAAWVWAVGAGGLVLLAAFVAQQRHREQRTGSALLPMRLFGDRGFSAGLVTQGAFQGSLAGFALVLTIYVQTGLGWSAIHAGLTLLPFSLGAFVGTGISVPLGMRLGKVVMATGAALQSAATVWVLATIHGQGDGLTTWDLVPALVVSGIGLGLLVVPLVDVALATVPSAEAGAASGAYGTVQQVGAALGIAIAGTVFFTDVGTSYDAASLRSGLMAACWVAACGYALAALASLLLPSRDQVHAHQEAVERELELAPR